MARWNNGTRRASLSSPEHTLGEHRNEEPFKEEAADRLDRRHDALRTVRRERCCEYPTVEGRDTQHRRFPPAEVGRAGLAQAVVEGGEARDQHDIGDEHPSHAVAVAG